MTLFTCHPLPNGQTWKITRRYGEERALYAKFGMQWGHNGVDFAAPTGTPVFAPLAGKAVVGSDPPGFGTYVKVVAGDCEVIAAHLSKVTVRNGEQVAAGAQIGQVGSTGNSTGPHLHFGLRLLNPRPENGQKGWIDPLPYLRQIGGRVSRQAVHYVPTTENPRSRLAQFERMQPRVIKLVQTRPGDTNAWNSRDFMAELTERLPRTEIIIRAWAIADGMASEGDEHAAILADPAGMAKRHAERWRAAAEGLRGVIDTDRTYWESINEPPTWVSEEAFDVYGAEYWRWMFEFRLLAHGLEWSVAHPGNRGVQGAPPDWSAYKRWRPWVETWGRLGAHEYWDIAGPEQGWGWWAGSVLRPDVTGGPVRALVDLTEVGVDRKVNPAMAGLADGERGWRRWLSAAQYLDQLRGYERLLRERYPTDWRLNSVMAFTLDGAEPWPSFFIQGEVLDGLVADAEAQGWEATAPQRLADVIEPTPQPKPPADAPVWTAGQRVATTGRLNVRSEPGTKAERLATTDKGVTGVVLERAGEWYKIDWDDEALPTGWSFHAYLTAAGPIKTPLTLEALAARVEALEARVDGLASAG